MPSENLEMQHFLVSSRLSNCAWESSSLRMAPTVFVKKKFRKLCICTDYQELNNMTTMPLPDEDQNLGRIRIWISTSYLYADKACMLIREVKVQQIRGQTHRKLCTEPSSCESQTISLSDPVEKVETLIADRKHWLHSIMPCFNLQFYCTWNSCADTGR